MMSTGARVRKGLKVFLEMTRFNFIPASILPFLAGVMFAVYKGYEVSVMPVVAGFLGVISAHAGGNALNNYFDYRMGADSLSVHTSPFFGGSKVIVSGSAAPALCLMTGAFLMVLALGAGIAVYIMTAGIGVLMFMLAGGALTAAYSMPPMKLAYRYYGELVIFLLFGPMLICGAFYVVTGTVTGSAIAMSLPLSFLITSVIVCNEVPDHGMDVVAGKKNLISLIGPDNGYKLFWTLAVLSVASLIIDVLSGILPPLVLSCVLLYFPALRAGKVLKKRSGDPEGLVEAGANTILMYNIVGVCLIVSVLVSTLTWNG
ncbi:MAG: prenyltransferase [Candidatus Omnitrophica bacterium]|nr:prenyltransferase [Candidatus Omnitrophota bacterium]MDD5487683.1 prenyltransferase [Candidatus Omnitrophota bacterium]